MKSSFWSLVFELCSLQEKVNKLPNKLDEQFKDIVVKFMEEMRNNIYITLV